ncbi:histidinol-phosphate transaminase [Haloplasma contractile]|uniref:Histidinol-phosphate aminotransferase n=1 Tax=Haloplasma contractile SSD-17B TaxID=1033810 RepID=U2DT40_9MOLU|nr:histidinol-phosphate transaminase [Haloplasma contractile]ERJ11657.1 Histidinol-phosphate aminotransferase protein [Haloplasma contractile SSD-17B]
MKIIDYIKQDIKYLPLYQSGKPSELSMEELKVDFIKLSSNENPFGSSKTISKVLYDSLTNLHVYPDGSCTLLKQTLSKFHNIDYDQIIVGNGSDEIIDFAIQMMVQPGDEVIMANPSFIKYDLTVKKSEGKSVKVSLNDQYNHDLDQMIQKITDKTKVIFICSPNNPTGTLVNNEDLSKFIERVPSHILIVIDGAYYEYVTNLDQLYSINHVIQKDNVLLLRTFSKIYGLASLRVGYGIANKALIAMLDRVRGPFNVNALAQKGAEAALSDQNHVKRSKELNELGKHYLYKQLEEYGFSYIPTEGNFIMIQLDIDSDSVYKRMLANGIIIRSGNKLGMPNWIRVTIGKMDDNEKFISILKQIKGSVEDGGCNESE